MTPVAWESGCRAVSEDISAVFGNLTANVLLCMAWWTGMKLPSWMAVDEIRQAALAGQALRQTPILNQYHSSFNVMEVVADVPWDALVLLGFKGGVAGGRHPRMRKRYAHGRWSESYPLPSPSHHCLPPDARLPTLHSTTPCRRDDTSRDGLFPFPPMPTYLSMRQRAEHLHLLASADSSHS